ncbi:MAG TPA: hypothetical protein VEY93_14745 [Longimicrobium sp.]|nr:hypothetical protein [Longimicrobium sp.]
MSKAVVFASAATLFTLVLGLGCHPQSGHLAAADNGSSSLGGNALLEARGDTGVELRVVLARDTISARDRSPVDVYYFIANGPTLTEFDNHPDAFFFKITGLDGSQVIPSESTSPILTAEGRRVRMVLPAGALLGQVQDLRCIVRGRYITTPEIRRSCLAVYQFHRPGTYRIIVEYKGRPQVNLDSLTALADSGKLERPIYEYLARNRRLVDTASLVVVP